MESKREPDKASEAEVSSRLMFGRRLREEGVDGAEELEMVFGQNYYSLFFALLNREYGTESELKKLRTHHIFRRRKDDGTYEGWDRTYEAHRLFYDAEYQGAFHRLNHALIKRMDMSGSLAGLISEAVGMYRMQS